MFELWKIVSVLLKPEKLSGSNPEDVKEAVELNFSQIRGLKLQKFYWAKVLLAS